MRRSPTLLLLPFAAAAPTAGWTAESHSWGRGAVPDAFTDTDGTTYLYHCGGGGISRARVLGDRLDTPERVSIAGGPLGCDPTVAKLGDRYVLYYKVAQGAGGPDQAKHTIHAVRSTDGVAFAYEGLLIEMRSDGRHVSVPDAVVLLDGRVRLYYVGGEAVKSHVSMDPEGLVFVEEPGSACPARPST